MDSASGLHRLGLALKIFGYCLFGLTFGLLAIGSANNKLLNAVLISSFVLVPGLVSWVVGWIVQGFSKST